LQSTANDRTDCRFGATSDHQALAADVSQRRLGLRVGTRQQHRSGRLGALAILAHCCEVRSKVRVSARQLVRKRHTPQSYRESSAKNWVVLKT
jgi:hypothetical protein